MSGVLNICISVVKFMLLVCMLPFHRVFYCKAVYEIIYFSDHLTFCWMEDIGFSFGH